MSSSIPAPNPACLNCDAPLRGRYCARCGQEDRPAAQPLGPWLRDLLQDVFSLDSRLVRTLSLLVFAPGEATARYVAGRRRPQTPPLRLYIGVSAVAIAIMGLTGMVEFEGAFRDLSPSQTEEIAQIFGVDDFRDPAFRSAFDRRFNLVFPLLNLLTPLGLALSLKLVIPRVLTQVHGVAALHLSTTMVLVGIPPVLLAIGSSALGLLGAAAAAVFLAIATWRTLTRLQPADADGGGSGVPGVGPTLGRWIAVMVTYFVLANAIGLATMAIVFLTV